MESKDQIGADRPGRIGLLAVLLVVAPVGSTVLAGGADAASMTLEPTIFVGHPMGPSAVWNGSSMYSFGGMHSGPAKHIWLFDPATEEVVHVREEDLPSERLLMGSAWTGEKAYLFGGYGVPSVFLRYKTFGDGPSGSPNSPYIDEILEYDTDADRLTKQTARLPEGLASMAVAYNGTHAFLLGGARSAGQNSQIPAASEKVYRYDPARDDLDLMDAQLPQGRWDSASVWTGEHAFLFGGKVGQDDYVGDILRYSPAADSIVTMDAELPTPRAAMTAIWDGEHAYIIGGTNGSAYYPDVLRYDPVEDEIETLNIRLHTGVAWLRSVWTGSVGYIYGGANETAKFGAIYRLDPSNQPPAASFTFRTDGLRVEADGTNATDVEGPITSYVWDWGDRTERSTGPRAAHSYQREGTYTITLTVEDAEGATGSIEREVRVGHSNQPPTADLTLLVEGHTVIADGAGSFDADGELASYAWDWGDGSPPSTGETAEHTYKQAGAHAVTLTVTDDDGAQDTRTQEVLLKTDRPSKTGEDGSASSFRVVARGLTVFTNASGLPNPTADPAQAQGHQHSHSDGHGHGGDVDPMHNGTSPSNPTSYIWEWGDGSPVDRGLNAKHVYEAPGTKLVRLTLLYEGGAREVFTRTVTLGGSERIQVQSVQPSGTNVPVDTPIDIEVAVANLGSATGSVPVKLFVDGQLVDETITTLDPSVAGKVLLRFVAREPGTHELEVTVGSAEPRSLSIEVQPDSKDVPSVPIPGASGVALVPMLAAAAALAKRGRTAERET